MTLLVLFAAVAMMAHGPKSTGDTAADVRRVLEQNAKGFETGHMHALDSIWAHDESVTVFESGHVETTGRRSEV